jgi:hypothetical protein
LINEEDVFLGRSSAIGAIGGIWGMKASDIEILLIKKDEGVHWVRYTIKWEGDVLGSSVGIVDKESIKLWLNLSSVGRNERTHDKYFAKPRRNLDFRCVLIEGEEEIQAVSKITCAFNEKGKDLS